ncbi:hypothetical protein C8R44DRAFT_772035 [Mycena epipterygia]|nr:hypothetical protein C8R44DRAFT_772035 [Mycena epipterygia]
MLARCVSCPTVSLEWMVSIQEPPHHALAAGYNLKVSGLLLSARTSIWYSSGRQCYPMTCSQTSISISCGQNLSVRRLGRNRVRQRKQDTFWAGWCSGTCACTPSLCAIPFQRHRALADARAWEVGDTVTSNGGAFVLTILLLFTCATTCSSSSILSLPWGGIY